MAKFDDIRIFPDQTPLVPCMNKIDKFYSLPRAIVKVEMSPVFDIVYNLFVFPQLYPCQVVFKRFFVHVIFMLFLSGYTKTAMATVKGNVKRQQKGINNSYSYHSYQQFSRVPT